MRRLPMPTDASGKLYVAKDVFKLCISRVKNQGLKQRLTKMADVVEGASAAFDAAAQTVQMHTMVRSHLAGSGVTTQEMLTVYTGRMVKGSQPGRPIYDRIRNAAALNRCPLCAVGVVTTLDHHLPKGKFPILAVTPNNLVPSCTWCQDAKDQSYPASQEQQTFHPYFDDFETDIWLRAVAAEVVPASFTFEVDPPAHWNGLKAARARTHLKVFRLGELYTSNAGQEVVDIRQRLGQLHLRGGKAAVSAHLSEEAFTRRSAHLNSWQSAMYFAAARSDWFCDGGFNQL